jgi:hypothetical protein
MVRAGIFAVANQGGMEGFTIAGASKAIKERFARQASASNAGKASAEAQANVRPNASRYPERPAKIDANKPVDWSKQSEQL